MSKKEEIITGSRIKWNGTLDLPLMYKKLREWLIQEKYDIPTESEYTEKIKGDAKELSFKWHTSKIEEDYFQLNIDIKVFIVGLKKIEVSDEQGRKMDLNKGDTEIFVDAYLIKDPNNKFQEKSFKKRIYESYIIPSHIEYYKIEQYKDALKFIEEIKSFLSLYKF